MTCKDCKFAYTSDWPKPASCCLVANGCYGTDRGERLKKALADAGGKNWPDIPDCPEAEAGPPIYTEPS
jgi:hypothetical protein